MSIALIIIGALASLVGGIWFLVVAFRQSVVWGLVVIFVPFASLVFLVKYWREAKTSFFVQLIGSVIYVAGAWNMISAKFEGRPMPSGPIASWEHHDSSRARRDNGHDDYMPAPTDQPKAAPETANESADGEPASTPAVPPASRLARHEAREPDSPAKPHRIRLSTARAHIGEPMRITGTNDVVREGTLRKVDGDDLFFERRLQGGTMSFTMRTQDIARLESLAN